MSNVDPTGTWCIEHLADGTAILNVEDSAGKIISEVLGSVASKALGVGGVIVDILLNAEPTSNQDEAPTWSDNPEEMDKILGFSGVPVPDGPDTPGRDKVRWKVLDNVDITYEKHPYDDGAPTSHTGPHWHVNTRNSHDTYLSEDKMPGYNY